MTIVLASASPRRRELLAQAGLSFLVRPAETEERFDPAQDAAAEVLRVARAKGAAAQRAPDELVISADTVVTLDRRVLGKPNDEAEAKAMLRALSGRRHTVLTGLSVRRGAEEAGVTAATGVWFRDLSDREIDAYVATGEPMDKAGAYGIQGRAAVFAARIDGEYSNVVGLPLCALAGLLARFGIPIPQGGET